MRELCLLAYGTLKTQRRVSLGSMLHFVTVSFVLGLTRPQFDNVWRQATRQSRYSSILAGVFACRLEAIESLPSCMVVALQLLG